MIYVAFTLG